MKATVVTESHQTSVAMPAWCMMLCILLLLCGGVVGLTVSPPHRVLAEYPGEPSSGDVAGYTVDTINRPPNQHLSTIGSTVVVPCLWGTAAVRMLLENPASLSDSSSPTGAIISISRSQGTDPTLYLTSSVIDLTGLFVGGSAPSIVSCGEHLSLALLAGFQTMRVWAQDIDNGKVLIDVTYRSTSFPDEGWTRGQWGVEVDDTTSFSMNRGVATFRECSMTLATGQSMTLVTGDAVASTIEGDQERPLVVLSDPSQEGTMFQVSWGPDDGSTPDQSH